MRTEICFIDDEIIAPEGMDIGRLNAAILKYSLKALSWPSPEVKNLVEKLVNDADNWTVSAFTNPNIYLNAVEDEGYSPEIIIYDWEYPVVVDSPIKILEEILQKTYAAVYIYSNTDHKILIDAALRDTTLHTYIDKRLFILMKTEGSPDELVKKATELSTSNFSFKFGKLLRLTTIEAINSILVEFGKHDIDFIRNLVVLSEHVKQETVLKEMISTKIMHKLTESGDLLNALITEGGLTEEAASTVYEIIKGKLSAKLSELVLQDIPQKEKDNNNENDNKKAEPETLKKLWSLRLYYKPSDRLVRSGDIVKMSTDSSLYMVITPNCDLSKFWTKCFGYINLVKLYDIKDDKDCIIEYLIHKMTTKKANETYESLKLGQSLTAKNINNFPEGPFILPFVTAGDRLQYLMGFPKELSSYKVNHPTGKDEKPVKLSYEQWVEAKRLCTIGEPFVSPLISHCLSSVAGHGTPDYPDNLKNAIQNDIKTS
ncbi:MAG: hypothetical protein HQL01_08870 [Nitrospirae bacterium]|nr:hypothetical protein [Nitrospirota bacterium]